MELFLHSKLFISSYNPWLALLVVFTLQVSMIASQNCGKLFVMGNDGLASTVCQKEYLTHECIRFTKTRNVDDLPEENMKGFSVQSPHALEVLATMSADIEERQYNFYPKLELKWKSPSTDTARRSVLGFYLLVESDDKKQTLCRIFTIDHSKYISDELEFIYQIEKISVIEARNYSVRIYSLPLPNKPNPITSWMADKDNFKGVVVTTNKPYSKPLTSNITPADWKATITVEPNMADRSIDVWFTTPHSSLDFKFTNYSINLMDMVKNPFNPMKNNQVFIPLDSDAKSGHTKFTDLNRVGWYRVSVRVIDLHRYDQDKCQCYTIEKTFIGDLRECASSCPFSRSAIFDLNGDVTQNPKEATHAPFFKSTTSTQRPQTEEPPTDGVRACEA